MMFMDVDNDAKVDYKELSGALKIDESSARTIMSGGVAWTLDSVKGFYFLIHDVFESLDAKIKERGMLAAHLNLAPELQALIGDDLSKFDADKDGQLDVGEHMILIYYLNRIKIDPKSEAKLKDLNLDGFVSWEEGLHFKRLQQQNGYWPYFAVVAVAVILRILFRFLA
jgi:hypothetical protein